MKAIIKEIVEWTGIHELNKEEKISLLEDFVKMIILIFTLCAFISVTGM
jgi:hypothetical protein